MGGELLDNGLADWEKLALRGDYSAMPKSFSWNGSARFAHFLNGYDEVGGLDPLGGLCEWHRPIADAQHRTGKWDGTAKDLWLCLFFEHRAARHCGSEAEGPELQRLDSLCEALRIALRRLSGYEARTLASRTRSE